MTQMALVDGMDIKALVAGLDVDPDSALAPAVQKRPGWPVPFRREPSPCRPPKNVGNSVNSSA